MEGESDAGAPYEEGANAEMAENYLEGEEFIAEPDEHGADNNNSLEEQNMETSLGEDGACNDDGGEGAAEGANINGLGEEYCVIDEVSTQDEEAKEAEKKRKKDERDSVSVECFTCGSKDHFAGECTGDTATAQWCVKCGNKDHLQDACTLDELDKARNLPCEGFLGSYRRFEIESKREVRARTVLVDGVGVTDLYSDVLKRAVERSEYIALRMRTSSDAAPAEESEEKKAKCRNQGYIELVFPSIASAEAEAALLKNDLPNARVIHTMSLNVPGSEAAKAEANRLCDKYRRRGLNPDTSLALFGVTTEMTADDLQAVFGDAAQVFIPRDWKDSTNKRFAYAQFTNNSDKEAWRTSTTAPEVRGEKLPLLPLVTMPSASHVQEKCSRIIEREKKEGCVLPGPMRRHFEQLYAMAEYYTLWGDATELGDYPDRERAHLKKCAADMAKLLADEGKPRKEKEKVKEEKTEDDEKEDKKSPRRKSEKRSRSRSRDRKRSRDRSERRKRSGSRGPRRERDLPRPRRRSRSPRDARGPRDRRGRRPEMGGMDQGAMMMNQMMMNNTLPLINPQMVQLRQAANPFQALAAMQMQQQLQQQMPQQQQHMMMGRHNNMENPGGDWSRQQSDRGSSDRQGGFGRPSDRMDSSNRNTSDGGGFSFGQSDRTGGSSDRNATGGGGFSFGKSDRAGGSSDRMGNQSDRMGNQSDRMGSSDRNASGRNFSFGQGARSGRE